MSTVFFSVTITPEGVERCWSKNTFQILVNPRRGEWQDMINPPSKILNEWVRNTSLYRRKQGATIPNLQKL